MTILLPPVVLLLLANVLTAGVLAVVARSHRTVSAARALLVALAADIVWTAAYAMEIVAVSPEAMVFWANVQFFGIGTLPIAWLVLVRRMFGWRGLRRTARWLLPVIPVATILLAFTDSWHGLFRGEPTAVVVGGLHLLEADYLQWHNFVFVPFQYLLYTAGIVLIFHNWANSRRRFASRYAVLAVSMLLPMVAGAFYVFSIPPFVAFNPTVLVMTISLGLLLASIRAGKLLDVLPVARERVVENLEDGVIVIDRNDMIVDFNNAAKRFFPELTDSALGEPFPRVLSRYVPLQVLAQGMEPHDAAFQHESRGTTQQYLFARRSLIHHYDGGEVGLALIVSDISDQVETLREAARSGDVSDPRFPRVEPWNGFLSLIDAEIKRTAPGMDPLWVGVAHAPGDSPLSELFRESLGMPASLTRIGERDVAFTLFRKSYREAYGAIETLYTETNRSVPRLSFGVCAAVPHHMTTAEELLLHAERAVQDVRDSGGIEICPRCDLRRVYHVAAAGSRTADLKTLGEHGFVHCSLRSQVAGVLRGWFAGQEDNLEVLEIDIAGVEAGVRLEPGTAGEPELFPHVYGPIPESAVVSRHLTSEFL